MSQLSHLLTQTVTIAPMTGVGNSGDPTYGAQVTKKARVQTGIKIVASGTENERQATHTIYLEESVGLNDRIWLPGDNTADTTAARRPIDVASSPLPDLSLNLYKVML
jgi:hypothetical protein